MVTIDPNLVLTLWTGSIVPLAGVILYYWLFRRFELRRTKHQEKRVAYKQFLRVIPKTVETLVDYQSLMKVKQPDPADPNAATAFFTQVTSMQSILKSRRAIDIVHESITAKPQVDSKQLTREQVLDMTRAKLLLEVGHMVISGMDEVDRCVEELWAFDLPEFVSDALNEVMKLYGERAAKIYANMIGEAFGTVTSYDDTASWMRDWSKALEDLKGEIEEDLGSM
jgi:hypothetical protein